MYVVTQNGKKLPVDTSSLKENDYMSFQQTVALYDDSTVLKPIWLVSGQKRNAFVSARTNDDLEFIAEKVYEHKPSLEELLWFMSSNGLTRYDIITIEKGYGLDVEYD